jgi:hypothetical protein
LQQLVRLGKARLEARTFRASPSNVFSVPNDPDLDSLLLSGNN